MSLHAKPPEAASSPSGPPAGAGPGIAPFVTTLDNGLSVWMSVDRDEPRIFASIVVGAGAAEDPAEATGVAHYLEHMLANKGTQRLGTLDHAREAPHLAEVAAAFEELRHTSDPAQRQALRDRIEAAELAAQAYAVPNELKQAWGRMGGRSLNATTSHERMNFFVDLPAEMLPRWARLEQDRFTAPVFRAFATEVRTICEEKSRALDNASRASREAMAAALWGQHPYGRPVLGELAHLASPSVRAMERFVARWLVPENMTVVLAGDLDPSAALELLRQTLGQLPRGWTAGVPERERTSGPPPLSGEHRVELVHQGQGAVHIGWRTVPHTHPDSLALRMAELVLSNGRSGRIDRELVHERRLRGGGAWSSHRNEGGHFVVWANPREGQDPDEAAALLLHEVERLRAGDIQPEVLAAVHRSFAVAELRRLETNRGRVEWMTRAVVAGRSPAEAAAREARIRTVTVEDIAAAAARWLGPDRVRVVRRPGTPELPQIEGLPPAPRPIQTARNSAFFSELLRSPVDPPAPRTLREGEHFSRQQGPWGTTIRNANPYSSLAQVQWLWERGARQDKLLATAARLVDLAGRPGQSAADLALKLHQLGVRSGIRVRRDSTALWVAGPAETLQQGLALIEDRWLAPVLGRELRVRELRDQLHRRRERRTTRQTCVDAARSFVLYGEDSGFLSRTPSPEELETLIQAELGAWGRGLCGAVRDCLATGPIEPAVLESFRTPVEAPLPLPAEGPLQKGRAATPVVYLLHHQGAQASVTVYRSAGPRQPGTEVLGAWLSTVLGGPAGLVFQELREARALAYSTGGALSRGERMGDDDLLWCGASTEPPRAVEAARLMVEMLQNGLPMVVSDETRVEAARVRLRQQLLSERVTFRAVPGAVRGWARLGMHQDPRPRWRLEVEQAVPASFRSGVAGLSLGAPLVLVVGDLARVDRAALAELGELRELSPVDVFGPDAGAPASGPEGGPVLGLAG